MPLRMTDLSTPLGPMTVALRGEALALAAFTDTAAHLLAGLERRFPGAERRSEPAPAEVARAFEAYWAGEIRAVDALAVDLGGAPFQAGIWAALRKIPAGATASYGDLARAAGTAGASRAVGAANGANPVWIVVPCHRVIRSDGSLCGYGGGVDRKRWLLAHEAKHARGAVA
jgi:methylated-DNA-[protein]-cysteine S-methyltransferase